MRKRCLMVLGAGALACGAVQAALAETPRSVRGLIAEHCIECHRVPGFALEGRNPAIEAPDFQAIADDRKTYTRERLAAFLRQPHFPMRKFVLSESDIRNIIAFIDGLGGPPQTQ